MAELSEIAADHFSDRLSSIFFIVNDLSYHEIYKMKKVFLGGTANGSRWRDDFIKGLKIDYYNPVGETWTAEMKKEELRQREVSDFCLYVITPKMEGLYSIAEVTDDSNKRPSKTIFCFVYEDDGKSFSEKQIRSLEEVGQMIKRNGAHFFKTLKEVTDFLNKQ